MRLSPNFSELLLLVVWNLKDVAWNCVSHDQIVRFERSACIGMVVCSGKMWFLSLCLYCTSCLCFIALLSWPCTVGNGGRWHNWSIPATDRWWALKKLSFIVVLLVCANTHLMLHGFSYYSLQAHIRQVPTFFFWLVAYIIYVHDSISYKLDTHCLYTERGGRKLNNYIFIHIHTHQNVDNVLIGAHPY